MSSTVPAVMVLTEDFEYLRQSFR
ncbi:aroB': 3-dehydroquinate synthase [Bienertia sinuspersici]